MNEVDILSLEWPNSERDAHAIAPIILELRSRGRQCITGDIFSYLYYLVKYKPKVLLLTSFQGALINHHICKLSHFLGIKVVTLIAEGNTREVAIEEMTWGNNKERSLYFEKELLWSYRSQSLMHNYFPQLKGKTSVVGGVGFDRYKRLNFLKKSSFLKMVGNNDEYRKVIGLAGWGFDRIHETEFYYKNEKSILANYKKPQIELHRNDFILLQDILYKVISENTDVLFILRPHPGLTDYFYDEFKTLLSLSNIYYSKPRVCPFSISDLISASDLWGGYETTTCMEAWLLGKETFLINPSGGDFVRDITAKGSYQIATSEKFNAIVRSSENINCICDDLSDVTSQRKDIISSVIGFDDGESYLRAVNEIEPIIDDANSPKYSIIAMLRFVGLKGLISSIVRNINIVNKIRCLRLTDQNQIERFIAQYKNVKKKI